MAKLYFFPKNHKKLASELSIIPKQSFFLPLGDFLYFLRLKKALVVLSQWKLCHFNNVSEQDFTTNLVE